MTEVCFVNFLRIQGQSEEVVGNKLNAKEPAKATKERSASDTTLACITNSRIESELF